MQLATHNTETEHADLATGLQPPAGHELMK
jgi:hypothetical protein